jgi:hypothetical protein
MGSESPLGLSLYDTVIASKSVIARRLQAEEAISRTPPRAQRTEIGMKRSTCLPLALRILPSAPLAFKKNN